MHETCRDISRREHRTDDGTGMSVYQRATLGCVQRIADALEALARPHTSLSDEVERLRADNLELASQLARLLKNAKRQSRKKEKPRDPQEVS